MEERKERREIHNVTTAWHIPWEGVAVPLKEQQFP